MKYSLSINHRNMSKIFTLSFLLIVVSSEARIVNMYTTIQTDIWGNSQPITSYTIPNRGPNGWDQLLGSATDQAISFNLQPLFNTELKWGDSVRDMNNPNVWFKTNMGGQLSQRCTCPGHGYPCSCYDI
jgi:hypothetical protein